jgi:hypothetical protein
MRHEQFKDTSTYVRTNGPAELVQDRVDTNVFYSAAAAPDVPKIVGKMIVASFVALLATFAVTMAGSRESLFAIAICAVFLLMYFGVPTIFLRVEPKQGNQPDFDSFIRNGLTTYTGHVSARDAVIQILIVPVLLTFGALIMGLIAIAQL